MLIFQFKYQSIVIYDMKQKIQVSACLPVSPKNSSKRWTVASWNVHTSFSAIRRSTVLFSIFNFQVFNFQVFLNRIPALNSRATENEEHCAPAWSNVWDFASRDGSTGSNPVTFTGAKS